MMGRLVLGHFESGRFKSKTFFMCTDFGGHPRQYSDEKRFGSLFSYPGNQQAVHAVGKKESARPNKTQGL
jgi:hypothetical protein